MEPPNQKTDINFPPGRPTEDSIQSLCRNQILRPVYNVECMPGAGYQWLVHQAKTINRMEKGFKQCCKLENRLNCAEQKVMQEIYMELFALQQFLIPYHVPLMYFLFLVA